MTPAEKLRELQNDYVLADVCWAIYGEVPKSLREKYANGIPEHLKDST